MTLGKNRRVFFCQVWSSVTRAAMRVRSSAGRLFTVPLMRPSRVILESSCGSI